MGDKAAPAAGATSLADRLSFPTKGDATSSKEDVKTATTEDAKTSEDKNGSSDLAKAQTDGVPHEDIGSSLREPEFDVEVKLSDMQANPDNPLFSAKTFEELGLTKQILEGLYSLNFRKPSKIQERALPLLLANPPINLIGQSQSGTGKTAAFVLNCLARLDLANPLSQALILAPSRELARQIVGVVQVMGQFVPELTVGQAVPDVSQRGKSLSGQVIVGTPGTVMDMIRRRQLNAAELKVLVLDEADSMLDAQNLGMQCERVKALLPKTVQVVLFSATFPDYVVEFAGRFAPNANQITLKHEELTVEGIKQLYMDCNNEEDKYNCLVKLYGLMTIGSSIIFVRTRESADRIQRQMAEEGHKVAMLTGALEGKDRDATIDAFRTGKAKVLITTNVLARGIDVQSVSMVINYDVPTNQGSPDPETYLHRIGRTGRFGRVGVAITFVSDKRSWNDLFEIANFFQIKPIRLPNDDWDEVEEIVKKVIKSARAGTNMTNQ